MAEVVAERSTQTNLAQALAHLDEVQGDVRERVKASGPTIPSVQNIQSVRVIIVYPKVELPSMSERRPYFVR